MYLPDRGLIAELSGIKILCFGGVFILYAASVRVRCAKSHRRIDIIVEADDLEKAKQKALKQARNIYAPDKKATYNIIGIISETEAFENFFARMDTAEPESNP